VLFGNLYELGYDRYLINGINFGGKRVAPPPLDETGKPGGDPANRRAELWLNLRTALESGRFKIPHSDSLQSDLVNAGYKYTTIRVRDPYKFRGGLKPDGCDGRSSDIMMGRAPTI